MTRLWVDSSALLPLIDRADDWHERVDAAFREAAGRDDALVTSSYVLVESGALTMHRMGAEAFRRLGEVTERALEVIWVDEALHRAAWREAQRSRRGPSLVDWVGFLVMRDRRIDTALALDRHFLDRGFRTLPVLA